MKNTLALLDLAADLDTRWYTWAGDGDGPTAGTYVERGPTGYLPDAPFRTEYPATADAARTAPGRRWVAVAHAFVDEAMDFGEVEEEMDAFESVGDDLMAVHGQWLNAFSAGDARSMEEVVVVELGMSVPDDVYESIAAALTR